MNMLARIRNAEELLPSTLGGLHELFRSMLDQVTDLGPEWLPEGSAAGRALTVETSEKEVTVKLPLPGCESKNIDVEVIGDQLTIHAARTEVKDENDKRHYIRRERSFMDYQESVLLPVKVRGHEAKASYVDGILTVTLPRENPGSPDSHVVKVD